MQRQIGEALLIEKRSLTGDTVLNKKEEWNGTRVPRLRLESVQEVDETLESEESNLENEHVRRLRRGC